MAQATIGHCSDAGVAIGRDARGASNAHPGFGRMPKRVSPRPDFRSARSRSRNAAASVERSAATMLGMIYRDQAGNLSQTTHPKDNFQENFL